MLNYKKYKRFPTIRLSDRTWPDKDITHAPTWCSVDLRDGNQALINPMNIEEKMKFFELLVSLGFKEIEVGFPSASQIEFDFLRKLIEEKHIPEDVTVQVLTQAREDLLIKTFESLRGVRRAIVHIYNSTSLLQREIVFKKSKDEIKQIALNGVKIVKQLTKDFDGEIVLQYSPESFTGTEIEYALEICNEVCEVWQASPDNKVIINLPATVEMDLPCVYADQMEWFGRNLKNRESVVLSCHPHNDRGTGVAAGELALLAGVERLEGTLFGNGERTGNADLLNLAYNMLAHGVDPELDLEDINNIMSIYEECCKMPIHDRHPYAGKLVYTAFSGSHQDAIGKGIRQYKETNSSVWNVPYLPIDPSDIGREFDSLIRINSQSGKGGVNYIMNTYFNYNLPRSFQIDFSKVIQKESERSGEIPPEVIMQKFNEEYINGPNKLELVDVQISEQKEMTSVQLVINEEGKEKTIIGKGVGPIDATVNALNGIVKFDISDYSQHTLGSDGKAKAIAYLQIRLQNDICICGVGIDSNVVIASLKAIFRCVNRYLSSEL